MNKDSIKKRLKWRWAWALILALFVMPVAEAAEPGPGDSGTAQSPVVATGAPAPGWWGEMARQPWVKRLARMWTGEEPDDTGSAVIGGRMGAFLDLVEQGNLFDIFRKGGPIMWPLFCASLLSLGTVLERAGFFALERFRRNAAEQRKFMAALGEGHLEQAEAIGAGSRFYVVRVLGYALSHQGSAQEGAIQYAKERELHRYRRGIPMLDTVITLAPLLGLLGTVTGMMASFSLIGGELSAPGAITGGIAEALIATAFGLGIAITSLIPFNLMNQKLETATQEIEEAASAMMTLLAGRMNPPHGKGGVA
ncbi:MAG: MotA/TolQ/ExbB proton channel family protein [bacterium]